MMTNIEADTIEAATKTLACAADEIAALARRTGIGYIAAILSDSTYAAEATKNVGYYSSLVEEARGFKTLTRSELASVSTLPLILSRSS